MEKRPEIHAFLSTAMQAPFVSLASRVMLERTDLRAQVAEPSSIFFLAAALDARVLSGLLRLFGVAVAPRHGSR